MVKVKNATLYLCVTLTVLSQIQDYSAIVKPIMFAFWGILFVEVISSKPYLKKASSFIIWFPLVEFIILVEYLVASIVIRGNEYAPWSILRLLLIPMFIYLLATLFGSNVSIDIRRVCFFYWLSALVLGAYISFRYVPTFSTWVQTVTYLYAGKNSVVQILCSSAILLIVLGKDYNSRFSIVKWAYILFAFVMTFLLRGRTAILSTVIAISVFVLSSKGNTKKRVTFVVIVCVILIAIISDDSLNLIVRHALGLDTYQSIDLDRFSSGRLTLYKNAIDLFASNWLIGVGDYYVDNFYINSITTLGIIGGGPLILMWVVRIIMIIRNFKKNPKNLICVASMTLSVFYFIESLLEAYPPFGPGSCSFMFWLLCGLSDSGFCLLEGESVKKQLTS